MTDTTRFDADTLYNYVFMALEKELGDTVQTNYLTDRVCDAVFDWLPKKGDLWLSSEDDYLYVHKGWELADGAPAGAVNRTA